MTSKQPPTIPSPKVKSPLDVRAMQRALAQAKDPTEALEIKSKLDLPERY